MKNNKVHFRLKNNSLLCGKDITDNFSASKLYPVTCPDCLRLHKEVMDKLKDVPKHWMYFEFIVEDFMFGKQI